MQDFPHRYSVVAQAGTEGEIDLESDGLSPLSSAAPSEFGGPGNRWSPETLLVGAVADCFVLTFRAVATASKLKWVSIQCEAEGTLDRIDRAIQFTAFDVRVKLRVPEGTDEERAKRLLARAEQACLISNSLKAESRLTSEIEFDR